MTHDKTQAALDALLNYKQANSDGSMVVTSRQAIDEIADYVRSSLTTQAELEAINKELLEAARELIDFDDTNIICDAQGDSGTWQSKELEEIIRKISVAVRQAITRAEKGGE